MKRTRKGFTLVELLIVIAILGALASLMTLSSGTATARAKASAIISGFKIVRTAAVMYEVDSADAGATMAHFRDVASKDYVGPESVKQLANYVVTQGTGDEANNWVATYTFPEGADDLVSKFTTIANEFGGITVTPAVAADPDATPAVTAQAASAKMLIK